MSETKDTQYNGWTNYETWAVKLWIDNDQGTQERWIEAAKDALEHANTTPAGKDTLTVDERAALALRETLKEDYEEQAEGWMKDQSSLFADLMNSSLSSVNWYEIAKSLVESAKEQV